MTKWVVLDQYRDEPDTELITPFRTRREAREEKNWLKKKSPNLVVKLGRITEVR